METREIAELIFLINVADAGKDYAPQDGPRIIPAQNGEKYDLEKIEQRVNELFAKFMEPYKIKE